MANTAAAFAAVRNTTVAHLDAVDALERSFDADTVRPDPEAPLDATS
jgi:hypothetical protein